MTLSSSQNIVIAGNMTQRGSARDLFGWSRKISLIRHGDGQAREQGRLEGQARVVQAQLLGLDAFGQEDCPLLPVTQRGSHDRSDQGGASIGALSCLLRLLRSSMCSVAKTTLLD